MTNEKPVAQPWYMIQKRRDIEAAEVSETVLGAEIGVFVGSMELLAEMLDAAFAGGTVHDLPTKMKLAVANHAFNLMWSAWVDTLGGRYDAASHHWRSIDESPDILGALQVKPELAKEVLHGRLKIGAARKTLGNELNRLEQGKGDDWLSNQKWRHIHNRFAHIDGPAVSALLPISINDGESSVLLRPGGGVIHEWNLRASAASIAEAALNLLFWVAFAFQHVKQVEEIWESKAREFNINNRHILGECARDIGVDVGGGRS